MLELVWQKTTVEDNTLTRHISMLRKALEERPGAHQYVLTVPGRGYQFVGDVIESEDQPGDLPRAGDANGSGAVVNRVPPSAGPQVSDLVVLPSAAAATKSHATLAIALVLALVAGTLVLATIRFNRTDLPSPQRVLRQFTFHSGLQRDPTWSPDGRLIAYASDRAGNSDIWVQELTSAHAVQLTSSPAEDSQPDWSPDGRTLVFRSEHAGGGLYIVPAQGGSEKRIASFGYQPRWSADGKLVLFSSSGHRGGIPRFHIVGLAGDPPRPLRPEIFKDFSARYVGWRADGRSVSIWGRDPAGQWTFLTIPIDEGPPVKSAVSGGVQQRIQEAGLTFERFAWSRSGRFLYFEGRAHETQSLWRISVDPATLRWIGGPDRLTVGTTQDGDVALSADETRLVFTARSVRTRLWMFPFDAVEGKITGAGQPVTSGGAGEQDADATDDGDKLVYRAVRGGRQEVWERSIADGRERLLLDGDEWTRTRPRWSSDGTRLAYLRRRRGTAGPAPTHHAVAVFSLDRRQQEDVVTKTGEAEMIPTDWSADGKWLLGGCPQGSQRRVGTCLLDVPEGEQPDGRVRLLTADSTHNLFEQRFSPDQRWIAFIAVDASDAGVSTVHVMPAESGAWQAITDGRTYDDKPHWAPDGRTVYFVSHRDGLLNLWGRRFDGTRGVPVGAPFQVTALNTPQQTISPQLSQMQIAITAKRLFLPITETQSELWLLENVDR